MEGEKGLPAILIKYEARHSLKRTGEEYFCGIQNICAVKS
jgi:hypothetical protein